MILQEGRYILKTTTEASLRTIPVQHNYLEFAKQFVNWKKNWSWQLVINKKNAPELTQEIFSALPMSEFCDFRIASLYYRLLKKNCSIGIEEHRLDYRFGVSDTAKFQFGAEYPSVDLDSAFTTAF